MGAVAAMVLMVLDGPLKPDLSSFLWWQLPLYGFLTISLGFTGMSMGVALKNRRPYKVVVGSLFGILAVILVARLLMTSTTVFKLV